MEVYMPNILIRDLSRKTVDQLKARARQHNRSFQGEVKHLIEEAVKTTGEAALLRARKIRASFGRKIFSDSAELLREERNR
jgi:plasmid stability protein